VDDKAPAEETRWWRYLRGLIEARDLTNHAFTQDLGVAASIIKNWRDLGAQPSVEVVHKVARYFGRPITEVMVNAEYLTWDDLDTVEPPPPLVKDLPNGELVDTLLTAATELKRRLEADGWATKTATVAKIKPETETKTATRGRRRAAGRG
jgi:hypothetical protein